MKKIRKILVGGREEGIRPKLPDHLLPRKRGKDSTYPPDHGGTLGPHRELQKQQLYLKDQVAYKQATPQQLAKGEQCATCINWKDGAACQIVLGFIHGDMWCNKWAESEILQKSKSLKSPSAVKAKKTHVFDALTQEPSVHSHRDDHPTHLHIAVHKEDGGGDGGALADGGTVFTSTNAGIFNPTYGEKKKKKTGIERLGQFLTDNSPEKKMIKANMSNLTDLVNAVRLELSKEDLNMRPPTLVEEPRKPEKEQTRTMNEDKPKADSDVIVKKAIGAVAPWNSGQADVDELHRGGKKDTIEPQKGKNEPDIPDDLDFKYRTKQLMKDGLDPIEALFKALEES